MYKCRVSSLIITAVLGLACSFGCINVDYVGQQFPPAPAGEPVVIYTPESPMPPDSYQAIGRLQLNAPGGESMEDIREELMSQARKYGADAVNVLEIKNITVGMSAPDTSSSRTPNWRNDGRNAGGAYIYSNSFGEITTLESPSRPVYELQLKALLMVENERFKRIENEIKKAAADQQEKLPADTEENAEDSAVGKSPDSAGEKAVQFELVPKSSSSENRPATVSLELNDDRRQPVNL